MQDYVKWSVRETEKFGVEIRLNTEVNIDIIKKENPDEVIIATGLNYVKPPISGIDGYNVMMIAEADHNLDQIGKSYRWSGNMRSVRSYLLIKRSRKREF